MKDEVKTNCFHFILHPFRSPAPTGIIRRERFVAGSKVMKLFAACVLASLFVCASACGGGEAERAASEMTGGGSPSRGRAAIRRYGCSTCHTIPGVEGADALVGPPLDRVASRTYIAGVLTNSPDNMVHWLRDPHRVD